ncbi:MAG: hypothetical protein IJ560_03250 [Alphaproteobacteria bacterium]|nr:hypothetical protein [Alphaproteobacteria bacterium]
MKNALLVLPVLALAACSDNKYSEYDSIFYWCQRIETSDEHLVYECPGDDEWAKNIKQVQPTGKFKEPGNLDLLKLYAETGNVFVEIAFNDAGVCKEDFTIRTMVAEPKKTTNWAVIGCI